MKFDSNKAKEYRDTVNNLSSDNVYERYIVNSFINQLRAIAVVNDDSLPNPTVIQAVPENCVVYLNSFLSHMGCTPQEIQLLPQKTAIWF